jgi:hypothetical protein
MLVASAPLRALAQPALAVTEIAEGDKSTRGHDFNAALAHYKNALQAAPSGRAQMGVADALYNLGRLGESFEAYNDTQNNFGPRLGPVEKALLAKRMKEIAGKTGWVTLRLAEAGADVVVDGRAMGPSPVQPLIRVPVGSREVKVTKAGFQPFVAKVDVGPDGTASLDVKLAPLAVQGHVVVHSTTPEVLRVTVDGVDVGATPWEGDVPAGQHVIAGRSSTSTADAQTVDVTAGSRTAIDLIAAGTAAHIQVRTSDGQGSIFLDGVEKTQGAFSGDVAPGPHSIVVTRDGYQRFEKSYTLAERQTVAETVTLQPAVATGPTDTEGDRGLEGIYGGFGFMGAFGVGGTGTELETGCTNLGAASCSTPNPVGGGAFGYVGWTWNPVGFELFVMGLGDATTQKADYNGSGTGSNGAINPASVPARTETFNFVRIGGMGAIRARATFQTRRLRGSIAGGLGLSYRALAMKRSTSDSAGDSLNYVPPQGATYVSPAISAEGNLQYRFSQTFAVAIGLQFWADNASIAGSNSVGPQSPIPYAGTTVPTPGYHLASGPQVGLGPFIGLAFGP